MNAAPGSEPHGLAVSLVRVLHGGVSATLALYSGVPHAELSALVSAIFPGVTDRVLVGFEDSSGVVVPVSVAMRFPEAMENAEYTNDVKHEKKEIS